MKNLSKSIAFLFLIMTFIISSCSNDDSATTNEDPIVEDPIVEDPIVINEFMTAKINGVPYAATIFTGNLISAGGYTSLILQGRSGAFRLTVQVRSISNGVGTYQVSVTSGGVVSYIDGTAPNLLWSNPNINSTIFDNYGQIEITAMTDTEVTGTFNATILNTVDNSNKTVTEGAFNIALD